MTNLAKIFLPNEIFPDKSLHYQQPVWCQSMKRKGEASKLYAPVVILGYINCIKVVRSFKRNNETITTLMLLLLLLNMISLFEFLSQSGPIFRVIIYETYLATVHVLGEPYLITTEIL